MAQVSQSNNGLTSWLKSIGKPKRQGKAVPSRDNRETISSQREEQLSVGTRPQKYPHVPTPPLTREQTTALFLSVPGTVRVVRPVQPFRLSPPPKDPIAIDNFNVILSGDVGLRLLLPRQLVDQYSRMALSTETPEGAQVQPRLDAIEHVLGALAVAAWSIVSGSELALKDYTSAQEAFEALEALCRKTGDPHAFGSILECGRQYLQSAGMHLEKARENMTALLAEIIQKVYAPIVIEHRFDENEYNRPSFRDSVGRYVEAEEGYSESSRKYPLPPSQTDEGPLSTSDSAKRRLAETLGIASWYDAKFQKRENERRKRYYAAAGRNVPTASDFRLEFSTQVLNAAEDLVASCSGLLEYLDKALETNVEMQDYAGRVPRERRVKAPSTVQHEVSQNLTTVAKAERASMYTFSREVVQDVLKMIDRFRGDYARNVGIEFS